MVDTITASDKQIARLQIEFGGIWPLRTIVLKAVNRVNGTLIDAKTIGTIETNEYGFFEFVSIIADRGFVFDKDSIQHADRELRITADSQLKDQIEGKIKHLIDVAAEAAELKIRTAMK